LISEEESWQHISSCQTVQTKSVLVG